VKLTVPVEVKNRGATVAVQPGVNGAAEVLWGLIIRPPRSVYQASQLGPLHFRVGRNTCVRRIDTELKNPRGHALRCSFFEPMPQVAWEASRTDAQASSPRVSKADLVARQGSGASVGGRGARDSLQPLPCIIFLHGNSSCRLEAMSLLPLLMPLGVSLFCFDFSGCGLSDGDYVSLGWFERDDLATCIDYLRSLGRVSRIGLWGRSMGAFTALLHADRDPSIAGLVLDSPFTSLSTLAEELAHSHAKVPAWLVRGVLVLVRSVIQSKANFDIHQLEAKEHVKQSFSPAFFIAAKGDDFINPHHGQELHDAWPGEKEITIVLGDHNSVRPEACLQRAALFLCRAFHDPRLDKVLEMHASGLYDIFAGPPTFPQAATTDNVTKTSSGDDDEGQLCRQLRLFPALRMMRLMSQRRCRRPLFAQTMIRLQQDHSEAGFFMRLEPIQNNEISQTRRSGTLDDLISFVPRLLVITVSTEALIISRICDDALETVAATRGPQPRTTNPLTVEMTIDGTLRVRLGSDCPLEVSLGGPLREEVTLWIMLLRGLTQFGPLTVEDGEATLRERLGSTLLESRHLGPVGAATRIASTCAPAPLPVGDIALDPAESIRPPSEVVNAVGADGSGALLNDPDHDRAQTMDDCKFRPEALIGWRVNVHGTGDGLIIGVKRRWGRTTLHIVSCVRPAQPPAKCRRQQEQSPGSEAVEEKTTVIMLCRKDIHRRFRRGRAFDLLHKEY